MEKKSRRGLPVYRQNPSVSSAIATSKTGVKRISNPMGNEMIIAHSHTGEIVAGVDVGFHQRVKVDKTQFVKLYITGVSAFVGLSKAGASALEMVISETHKNPGKDRIYLSPLMADELWGVTKRTYLRGMKELIEKEILFEYIEDNWYFINVNYMFNGDRLAFLKTYELKSEDDNTDINPNQPALPFNGDIKC